MAQQQETTWYPQHLVAYARVDARAKVVLFALDFFHRRYKGKVFPSHQMLCRVTGRAESTVKGGITTLESCGILDVDRVHGKRNRYFLNYERMKELQMEPLVEDDGFQVFSTQPNNGSVAAGDRLGAADAGSSISAPSKAPIGSVGAGDDLSHSRREPVTQPVDGSDPASYRLRELTQREKKRVTQECEREQGGESWRGRRGPRVPRTTAAEADADLDGLSEADRIRLYEAVVDRLRASEHTRQEMLDRREERMLLRPVRMSMHRLLMAGVLNNDVEETDDGAKTERDAVRGGAADEPVARGSDDLGDAPGDACVQEAQERGAEHGAGRGADPGDAGDSTGCDRGSDGDDRRRDGTGGGPGR